MDKSKEKIKENPIVANRAIYMANPCHIIDKVVPLYWHNSYTNEKSSDNHRLSESANSSAAVISKSVAFILAPPKA